MRRLVKLVVLGVVVMLGGGAARASGPWFTSVRDHGELELRLFFTR